MKLDFDDVALYIDKKARHEWFHQQPLVCQGCLNLDWYYTRSCTVGDKHKRENNLECPFKREEA